VAIRELRRPPGILSRRQCRICPIPPQWTHVFFRVQPSSHSRRPARTRQPQVMRLRGAWNRGSTREPRRQAWARQEQGCRGEWKRCGMSRTQIRTIAALHSSVGHRRNLRSSISLRTQLTATSLSSIPRREQRRPRWIPLRRRTPQASQCWDRRRGQASEEHGPWSLPSSRWTRRPRAGIHLIQNRRRRTLPQRQPLAQQRTSVLGRSTRHSRSR
jgi:hypothetical protein